MCIGTCSPCSFRGSTTTGWRFPPGGGRALLLRGGYDKDDLFRALDETDGIARAVPATPEPPGRTATTDPPAE